MEKGNISNVVVPRVVVVFEDFIASLPNDTARRKFDLASRKGKWNKAFSQFRYNSLVLQVIMDAVFRRGIALDTVTFIDEEFTEVISAKLDEEGIPVGRVFYSTPERLSRSLAYRPDISYVCDPDPKRQFTYGGKGVFVSVANPNLLGE